MKTIGFLFIMVLITGCVKEKTYCTAYPEKNLNWIPYKPGETFSYTDGTDTFQLRVGEAYRSAAYTIKQGWIYERMCNVEAYANLFSDSNIRKAGFTSSFPEPAQDLNIDTSFVFYHVEVLGDDWSAFSFVIRNGQVDLTDYHDADSLLSSYNNGYREYCNVLRLKGNPEYQISQLYLAESVGIIQFKDRKYFKTWSLVGR